MTKKISIYHWLKPFKSVKPDPCNLTCTRGGRWLIPKEHRDEFYKKVALAFKHGEEFYLQQCFPWEHRLVLDIDGVDDDGNQQVYWDDVSSIVDLVTETIDEYFQPNGFQHNKKREYRFFFDENNKVEGKFHVYITIEEGGEFKSIAIPHFQYRPLIKYIQEKLGDIGKYVDPVSGLRLPCATHKEGNQKGMYVPEEATWEEIKTRSVWRGFSPRRKMHANSGDITDFYVIWNKKGEELMDVKISPQKYTPVDIPSDKLLNAFNEALEYIDADLPYREWNTLCKFFYGYGVEIGDVEEWSSLGEKYKPMETINMLESMSESNAEAAKTYWGLFYSRVRQGMNDDKKYFEWKTKYFGYTVANILPKDEYAIGQYVEEFSGKKFDSEETAWSESIEALSRFCRLVNVGDRIVVYRERMNEGFGMKKDDFTVKYKKSNLMYKKKEEDIEEGDDPYAQMNIFTPLYNCKKLWCRSMVFDPSCKLGRKVFNLFPGMRAKNLLNGVTSLPESAHTDRDTILDHVQKQLFRDNEEHYHWFLTWLAAIVQTPEKKTEIMVLLIGEKGCGKSIFVEFLMEYLFGMAISTKEQDLARLTDKFNASLARKIFVTVEEIGMGNKNRKVDWEVLKTTITDKYLAIEKKGVDRSSEDLNYVNMLACSNHERFRMEANQRRYGVFECDDEKVGDYEYFDNLDSAMNEESAMSLMQFLLEYKVDRTLLRRIPKTEIAERLRASSETAPEVFINRLVEELALEPELRDTDFLDSFSDDWDKKKSTLDQANKKVKASHLHNAFKKWHCNNYPTKSHSRCLGSKSFYQYLQNHGYKSQRGNAGNYYFF